MELFLWLRALLWDQNENHVKVRPHKKLKWKFEIDESSQKEVCPDKFVLRYLVVLFAFLYVCKS